MIGAVSSEPVWAPSCEHRFGHGSALPGTRHAVYEWVVAQGVWQRWAQAFIENASWFERKIGLRPTIGVTANRNAEQNTNERTTNLGSAPRVTNTYSTLFFQ